MFHFDDGRQFAYFMKDVNAYSCVLPPLDQGYWSSYAHYWDGEQAQFFYADSIDLDNGQIDYGLGDINSNVKSILSIPIKLLKESYSIVVSGKINLDGEEKQMMIPVSVPENSNFDSYVEFELPFQDVTSVFFIGDKYMSYHSGNAIKSVYRTGVLDDLKYFVLEI